MLKLIKPDKKYTESFEAFLNTFDTLSDAHGTWIYDEIYRWIDEFLERIDKSAKWLDPDYEIPATTYWLIMDELVVWTLNLRHSLNDFLLKKWWHIWYSIHTDYRWKWYGTGILKLWLEKAKEKWIEKVLVTCDDDNVASEKVILANGWVYENTIEGVKRYWIENIK